MEEPTSHPIEQIPVLVRRLYELVADFERLFPGRRFTPDGHLVGSIGEVIAAYKYDLELHAASNAGHDAIASDGRQVEIKATQGKTVALRSEPEHLLVLLLDFTGASSEVFNGPGRMVWQACGAPQKNGQRPISVAKLRILAKQVAPADRIACR